MQKKVCIIYTGGTIGMKPTEHGFAPKEGYLKSVLENMPELKSDEMPLFELIEYHPLLDSSYISVDEWVKIAKDIKDNHDKYDGFVILHGTDTMAYTASALSFMLDGIKKPIILTGSQIPFCKLRTDARDNLITSMLIAANYNIPEVCLYFGGKLLRGNRSTKVGSDQLVAFDSPNFPALLEAGVKMIPNTHIIKEADKNQELTLNEFKKHRIAVIKIFPGIQFATFQGLLTNDLKGIVIEAFGSGNVPGGPNLENLLRKAKENHTVVVVCTQCVRGSAVIGRYETSKILFENSAVSGYDMTVEAAVTKLYSLLSKDYPYDTIRALMEKNLKGELTEYLLDT